MNDIDLTVSARLSLDDPEAGRKLIANIRHRRIRMDWNDFRMLFRPASPEEDARLGALVKALCASGELVVPIRGLWCLPDMTKENRLELERLDLAGAIPSVLASVRPSRKPVGSKGKTSRGSVDAFVLAGLKRLGRPASIHELTEEARIKGVTGHLASVVNSCAKLARDGRLLRVGRGVYADLSVVIEPVKAAPAPSEATPAPAAPAPAARPSVPALSLARVGDWILRWLHAQGGSGYKTALVEAAASAGIAASVDQLDVPLQNLINRTRIMAQGHGGGRHISLTMFGSRDAEALTKRATAMHGVP